jgi:hypothetical protein
METASTEPSELHKSLINRAAYLRGKILTSYAQVEFLLADLSVKLDLRFPYLVRDRIKAAKRISERPGYESYKLELTTACDQLLEYDELQNFMAHGFLILTTDKNDNHEFEFRLYQRESSEKFNLVTIKTNIPLMEMASGHISAYVSQAVGLFQRIYDEKGLERSDS